MYENIKINQPQLIIFSFVLHFALSETFNSLVTDMQNPWHAALALQVIKAETVQLAVLCMYMHQQQI